MVALKDTTLPWFYVLRRGCFVFYYFMILLLYDIPTLHSYPSPIKQLLNNEHNAHCSYDIWICTTDSVEERGEEQKQLYKCVCESKSEFFIEKQKCLGAIGLTRRRNTVNSRVKYSDVVRYQQSAAE